MKQVILFLLFFVQVAVFGQKQVKNANKAFQKESYVAASKIYEDAVNSGDVTPELLRNLGDSYYYNARYAEAAPWYAKLFQLSSDQTAEYYFRYAQSLKSAQLQMRSDSVMAVYCSKFPTEIRAKNYLVKQRYFFENNPFLAIHLKNLEINTVYSDYGATIHGDSIYFASARPEILDPEEYERTQQPYTNLFVAKFIDTTVSRSKIYDNGKTFSVFHEATPTFSTDGKTMYYTKNELASKKNKTLVNGRYRIYKSIYENGKWIDKGVVNIKTNDSCRIAHPALSPDNKRLYFSSDMKGTYGQSDIFYVDLFDNDSVSLPVNLGTRINTEGRDSYPFVSQDNQLFFASEGHPGMGGFDVFVIDLNTTGTTPKNLAVPINSVDDDFAFVWKKDLYKAVLTSNRLGGKGDDDIYAFALPKQEPIKPAPTAPAAIVAMGKVTDSKTGAVLANSTVTVTDETGKVVATVSTDAEGNYNFPIVAGQSYQLAYVSNGYESAQQTLTIPATQTANSTVDQQLTPVLPVIEPVTPVVPAPTESVAIVAMGKVTDSKTGAVLANSTVTVTDATGKVVATVSTDAEGNYNFPIVAGQSYQLAYVSNGYESAQQTLTIPATQTANSTVDQQLTPVLPVIEPVTPVVPAPTEPVAIVAMGKVTDSKTGAVLANSIVTVTDATGKVVATVTTDAEGNYNFPIVAGQLYQLAYVSNGYESAQQTLTIPSTQITNRSVDQQLTPVPPVIEPVTPVVPAPTEPIAIGTDLAKVFAINPIYFDVNKAIIRPDAALELDKIVAFMNEHPELEIELGSHTDCRSSASYNKSLSDRRAKASAAYIKARIKHPERIKGKGYGESQLLNNCFCEDTIKSTCSEEEHQLNRRTEFKVVGIKMEKQPISESGGNNNPIVQQTKPKQTSGVIKPLNTVTPSINQEVVTQSENEKTPPLSFELGTDLAKLYAINPIYFDVNRAIIRPDAALELDKIVTIMNEHPELEIELGSHTDCRSTASYNQSLSNRRAKASAAYIKARISNPERITGKGYGESQLLNNCYCEDTLQSTCSDEEHQLNRRTEFRVVGYKTEKPARNQEPKPIVQKERTPLANKNEQNTLNKDSLLVSNGSNKPDQPLAIGTDLAKVYEIKPIYFDVNKALIRPDAATELDKIVAILNENPTMEIELGSHTDCRSTASYNQSLSNRRAKASAAYIKARISNPKRIIGKGYGESQLLNNCLCEDSIQSTCSEEEHQLNRRTEFKVVGYNGVINPNRKPVIDLEKGKIPSNKSVEKEISIQPNSPIVQTEKTDDKLVQITYPEGFVVGADLSKLLKINMIYFDLDKYNIRPDAALELDKIVAIMKQYPNMKIELTSHTDCRMPTDYNQRLSNNRARTSKSYLVAHGIKSARIVGKGLGETQLAVNCPCEGEESSLCTEEQHQLNRRTEFIILSL